MKNLKTGYFATMATAIIMLVSCGRESSPEGRMTMKIESLQKEMIDSLQQQNRAILDSLAALRKDVQALQQAKEQ